MEYVLPCTILSSTPGEVTLSYEGQTVVIPLPMTTPTLPAPTGALWLVLKDTPPEADLLNKLLSSHDDA